MITEIGWNTPDVVLVGGGNMGAALASGYLARMPQAWVIVVDPSADQARARLPQTGRVKVVPTVAELGAGRPSMTILAIKPQLMATVLPLLASFVAGQGLVISIAAGFSASAIARELPMARVVRAMPNTPALVGSGVTELWGDASVSAADHWVDDETEIDAVTALSGSGPAYLFAFVEALAEAGRAAGLSEALAAELARATLVGAASMLRDPASDPARLKAAVRSPQGTTDAALQIFEHAESLATLVGRAVAAAQARARELSRSACSMGVR